jgi:two-component system response regulator ParR
MSATSVQVASPPILQIGPLEIVPDARTVRAAGTTVYVTVLELRLLTEMALRPDRVLTRSELFKLVWGRQLRPGDRSVDVCVRKLRNKLEAELPDWRFIHTHFARGDRFAGESLELTASG